MLQAFCFYQWHSSINELKNIILAVHCWSVGWKEWKGDKLFNMFAIKPWNL